MDWLSVIDIKRALDNCRTDIIGDWFYDPWGWPELAWIVNEQDGQQLLARLDGTGVGRASRINVPKPNFGVRPAVVIDPVDRLVYQVSSIPSASPPSGALKDFVFGWRLVRISQRMAFTHGTAWQWDNYRDRLRRLAIESSSVLKTDIVSFFASVPVSRVIEALESRAGTGDVVRRIGQLLEEGTAYSFAQGCRNASAARPF